MITKGLGTYVCAPNYEYYDPEVEIGKFTSVAEMVRFCGSMNHPWNRNKQAVSNFPFLEVYGYDYTPAHFGRGKIVIGSDVWLGYGVTVLDGVTIGDGAIAGINAVVAKDVPPYSIVVGNPAKITGFRFPLEIVGKLLDIRWWDWDLDTIKERIADFNNINTFVEKYD